LDIVVETCKAVAMPVEQLERMLRAAQKYPRARQQRYHHHYSA
jgi:hypothetical protein